MSEPITRADLRWLAKMIDETEGDREKWPISDLVEAVFERSASNPRVPGASAKLEADFREFIKKAEPGNLAELIETVAYERGRRAGIEAAAQAAATYVYNLSPREWSVPNLLTTIRALADKPAPDALLPGLQHIMAYMIREPWTADTIRTFIQCEIAARKGG